MLFVEQLHPHAHPLGPHTTAVAWAPAGCSLFLLFIMTLLDCNTCVCNAFLSFFLSFFHTACACAYNAFLICMHVDLCRWAAMPWWLSP